MATNVHQTIARCCFNMVMREQEQEVQRRQRAVPENQKCQEPPPEAQTSQSQAEVTPLNSMSLCLHWI